MKGFCLVIVVCLTGVLLATACVAVPLDHSLRSDAWFASAFDDISPDRMMADIRELSGERLRGRQTGSRQDMESAAFVSDRFSALRLHRAPASPPDDRTNPLPQREWKQIRQVSVTTIQDDPVLGIDPQSGDSAARLGTDFLPVFDSPSADVEQSVVFVGYGLAADYAGIDVDGKIVFFLRGKPDTFTGSASHGDKERAAKEHGAIAYLTATGPVLTPYEQRRGVSGKPAAFYSMIEDAHRLPGAWISTHLAESVVQAGSGGTKSLRGLQEDLNRSGASLSINLQLKARLHWTSHVASGDLYNIASLIRGSSPAADETVLIGAHRDHFGRQGGLLFPGADDNASGTAVLLEVARVLALAPSAPKRSVLFVSFSGEEQGLLGSRLYVSQPIVPLGKTIAMINVDHAGAGNGRLTVGVTDLENALAVEAGTRSGLSDKVDLFGFFPGGDHVPFKEAGVPTVTVVSGGVHPNFHQSSDTAENIEPEKLRAVARYVLAVIWKLAYQ